MRKPGADGIRRDKRGRPGRGTEPARGSGARRWLAIGALLIAAGTAAAAARGAPPADLKLAPPGQQVTGIGFCRGEYEVTLRDGSTRLFPEYNLSFKTDAGSHGPRPQVPVLVPAGRVGDRAFVVFAGLDELKATPRNSC
jgi:hypothetical protein